MESLLRAYGDTQVKDHLKEMTLVPVFLLLQFFGSKGCGMASLLETLSTAESQLKAYDTARFEGNSGDTYA